MDEILHRPRGRSLPKEGPKGTAVRNFLTAALDTAARLGRRAGEVFHKTDAVLAGRRIGPVAFLAAGLLVSGLFVVSTVYTPSYVVTMDGKELGAVVSQADFERAVSRVEARASAILGYDYTLAQAPEYSFTLTEKSKISSLSGFETYLFNQVGEVMKSYVLTVNGEFVGASTSKAELDDMLSELTAPYTNENTVSAEFVGDVEITYEYTASDVEQNAEKIRSVLNSNTRDETVYTVVAGDTYSGIAYDNDMSLDELMALNPQASLDRLMIGDQLTVNASIPFLSVRTVDAVTYTQEIVCPVEERQDDTMYQGDKKVLQEGVPGEALISANVTYLDGVESQRDVTQTVTVREATTRIVAVGTKERPKTMPKGYFIWPVSGGRITSYFGYRSIFGTYSYHSGLDIAVPYGTSVAAADGGTVIWSGYKGSYGNLVIIDHGNGKQTYYGHNSSLLVSAGDKVYQGQTIARAGSTGRSTGNHCHFEVRIGGTAVNPLSYL